MDSPSVLLVTMQLSLLVAGQVAEGDRAQVLTLMSPLVYSFLDVGSQDISYPIDTKRSGIHGRLDLKPVDNDDCSRNLRGSNPRYRGLG